MIRALVILGFLAVVPACTNASPETTPDAPEATGDGGDAEPGPSCTADPGPATGEATYYDADGTGSCSFDRGGDLLVAAMNATDYDGAAWCGGCVEVTGPSGSVVVKVVDKCPGCSTGDLDLSRQAFSAIAPLSAGRVDISWTPVACPVEGAMAYQFKDGSSEFWTAIQVRNHRYPITKLEAQTGPDTWTSMRRLDYNYFVDSHGLGKGPYTLRVTDTRGHVVIDEGIALGDNVTRPGQAQFPTCQ